MFNVATNFFPVKCKRGTADALVPDMNSYSDQRTAAAAAVVTLCERGTKSELAAAMVLATRQGRVDDYAQLLAAWERS